MGDDLTLRDLLRLCSALGVEVPAGTVPTWAYDHERMVWGLHAGHRWLEFGYGGNSADPRAALDAIVAAVVPMEVKK